MTITDALNQAQTSHVIYFLLTAYLESLAWCHPPRSGLPARVLRLPLDGITDVIKRLHALRRVLQRNAHRVPGLGAVLEEAVEIFSTASQRLTSLAHGGAN